MLCGFSAGGQFVDRYVAVGKGKCREGIDLNYIAMSPSTWLHFTDSIGWHYGLGGDKPRYCESITEAQMNENLSTRTVWRCCGELDVDTPDLDMSPEAVIGGTNRYDRFLKFQPYLQQYPQWHSRSKFITIPATGHVNAEAYRHLVETYGILSL